MSEEDIREDERKKTIEAVVTVLGSRRLETGVLAAKYIKERLDRA